MEKPNDIIIRFTIYGFLIGIFFPVASLLIHTFTGDIRFSLYGFAQLHAQFPGQILLDLIPLFSTLGGGLAGYSESVHLSKLSRKILEENQRSDKLLEFTDKLINNQLDAELRLYNPEDPLGKALVNLRDNLKQNIDEQQRRKMEDDQRNWVSEGLAKFRDILRTPFEKMEDFAYNIISYLVKYMDANQGGFFLVEQENGQEKYFDLNASYAYDRRKFADPFASTKTVQSGHHYIQQHQVRLGISHHFNGALPIIGLGYIIPF